MKRKTLYAILIFLGVSLFLPGLFHTVALYPGERLIDAVHVNGLNQLRALNAMMAAMGLISFWCCHRVEQKRDLINALALILLVVSGARLYSIYADGLSSVTYLGYLGIEVVLALLLLALRPGQSNKRKEIESFSRVKPHGD